MHTFRLWMWLIRHTNVLHIKGQGVWRDNRGNLYCGRCTATLPNN